ncbi:protein KRBA1 isoform X3 [Octodon degus]|uniref:Protein KRBA1 isoform X3 n=1 Tax=Octodon degus TaxID=10160 RepID=A0A6P6E883_OCTDE|nr:protein KRBA1 isoform X3 [Octodon degus]
MARQVPISFKDLAVRFSEEEWRLLEEGQREFYRDVMRENYETLVSVGTAELLPLSAFLLPTEPGGTAGAGSRTEDGQELPVGGGPQGRQLQHSLHLTALVQLVKEIPEFLFGETKGTDDSPESGRASLDGDRASPQAVPGGTCPLQGLLSCLPDSPVSRPSLATTPTSSSSCSGPPRDGGQGSPLHVKAADRPRPTDKEGPEGPSAELSTPISSPSQRKSPRRQERVALGTGVSPGTSPLQGLINCLKEILVPRPQHPDAAPGRVPPVPGLGTSRQSRVDVGPGSLPWPVKTEATLGDCPLQGLLNCLKEIPETQDKPSSPSRAGSACVQEDPGPWKRNPEGPRRLQTLPHPASPGAGGALSTVKVEESWAQSSPVPTSCQLGRQGHSPSVTRDTRAVHMPFWGPEAQEGRAREAVREDARVLSPLAACRASSSPLAALEACLKGIPTSALSPPQPPATSWSRTPQPGDAGSQRPELQPQGSHSEDASRGPLAPVGPTQRSAPGGTPTSFSSASSTDGDLDFRSPWGSRGQHPGTGYPPGSSPLQGLENCLREIPVPRPQPAQPCASAAADRGLRRVESRSWMADKEGLKGEASEPARHAQGGEAPPQSPCLASPQALTSSCVPACHQQRLKDQGPTRPGLWRWPQDGVVARPSPLHCLESSLRGILPARPLRFTCLADPSPGPGPSSSSSLYSSDGEDLRPEPELWKPLLQERGHLPSCKRPIPQSPGPSGSPTGNSSSSSSSPADNPVRTESHDRSNLWAAGKAEETGGGSLRLRREECTGRACPPGLLSSAAARGGRVREAAGAPWPVPPPEKRPGPSASEDLRGPEPRCIRPSAAARTQGGLLPGDLPELPSNSPPPAAISPVWSDTSPRPPCPCRKPLQQELHSLGATLTEKLDQLAAALAGLAQEVATMRTQVDRLRRRPRGPGPKGSASWLWSLPRGPRWAYGSAHRHLPYWRQKGPTRPKPKILQAQAEGCRSGDPQGPCRVRVPPVPPLPADTLLAEPSRPSRSPPQQPPLGPSCPAVLTGHSLLGHPGCQQRPLPPFTPAALPPLRAPAAASTDPGPSAVGGTQVSVLARPKEPRALREDLWGAEHRDPRWGAR